MRKRKYFSICILLIMSWVSLFAQEGVVPLSVDYRLQQENISNQRAQVRGGQRASLVLPFADDFSYKSMYPNPNLWLSSGVCVDNNLQANPISYGTAVFNGLNQLGLPYNYPGGTENYGGFLTESFIAIC